MGDMSLRADPDSRSRGGAKPSRNLPVRVTRTRRRPLPRWVKRTALWGGIGTIVLSLGIGGVVMVRQGTAHGVAGSLGDGALSITGLMGLKVREILVEGRSRVPPQTVMTSLAVNRGAPILGVGVDSVRQRLEAIPWVESAVVERRLPDTIFVRLVERVPLALWQHNGKFSVIDAKGVVIQDEVGPFASLPIVVGDDAPPHAEALLLLLQTEPDLQKRVTAAIRVGGRRWNLKLDNGIDVRLPEEDAASAWSKLAALERENKLLARDVTAVDLRLPDRLIVRVGQESEPKPTPAKDDRVTKRPAAR